MFLRWPLIFDQMVVAIGCFQVFTAAMLLVKQAWWQAALVWGVLTPLLRHFHHHTTTRFHQVLARTGDL